MDEAVADVPYVRVKDKLRPDLKEPVDIQLGKAVAEYYSDPLGFVLFAFPWGKPGMLEKRPGPVDWQIKELERVGDLVRARKFDGTNPVEPIRIAISSGHGTGKSSIAAWLVLWIMSTRPEAQGTITANTFTQLSTKTWAAIQKWSKLSITARWFTVTGSQMYRNGQQGSWFCATQSCKEENSEAFAGQHAANSTSFYLFDESSGIPDKIWEVAEGGLTDGEPMIFALGNPTRNTGAFHAAVFGNDKNRWSTRIIDSRDSSLTNKPEIEKQLEKYGEDHDVFRVRVRGLPPRQSEVQFISHDAIWLAQARAGAPLRDDPLICGLDASGGGSARWVFRFRRGIDARSIKPVEMLGSAGREAVINQAAQLLSDTQRIISMMFVDSAFGSPVVERLHVLGFKNVIEVNFGDPSPDIHQENMRAFMWNQCKEWLPRGLLDKHDSVIEGDLSAPGFHYNKRGKLVLESKADMAARGVASPDHADGLVLTFAQPVAIKRPEPPRHYNSLPVEGGWMAA